MRIQSFHLNHGQLEKIEVELVLIPGLPQIQITGLPDTAIKESQWRIKSAVRACGYEWPRARKILVNLRPSHLRKTSPGLDLAVAVAYLCETGQLQFERKSQNLFFYGELGLKGEIGALPELKGLYELDGDLVTGASSDPLSIDHYESESLQGLDQLRFVEGQNLRSLIRRPGLTSFQFCKKSAEVLKLAAVGGHSLLVAGPAGTGKTTFAECLHLLGAEPSDGEVREIFMWARPNGKKPLWRPFVSPHHSTPSLSLIGGGSKNTPGEITYAHRGTLFLDEFLEFKGEVKEALREPIEKGEVHIARLGQFEIYPSDFHFVGATNLCPCGGLKPGQPNNCSYSLSRCQRYLHKLSGPILDRFQMVSLSHQWKAEKDFSLEKIFEDVQSAQQFGQENGRRSNAKCDIGVIKESLSEFTYKNLMPETGDSLRREEAVLRVARSVADLDCSLTIEGRHLQMAAQYALTPLREIQQALS